MKDEPQIRAYLRVRSHDSALTEVWQWFEQATQTLLSEDLQWQCRLALTEGFTNVIRHAHQQLPEVTPIEIELQLSTDFLEIRIWDQGRPFNLEQTLALMLHQGKHHLLEEGGRGLLLMSQLMDELYYQRDKDDRNCLLMIKTLKKKP